MTAWTPGDPPGSRKFVTVGDVTLESGEVLPGVQFAYETWGTFTGDNAVLVLHALTGDSHVVGGIEPGHLSPGWWDGLVGPGKGIDTNEFFVVAPNILGGCQGTTGPASLAADNKPWGSRFPKLTTRDQVNAEIAFADAIGIDKWALVIGGSAGGMRALEWAITVPGRVERLMTIASTAAASAEQIGFTHTQNDAIRADANYASGDYYATGKQPDVGLDIARRIAHITYRSEEELSVRFGRNVQDDGRFAVNSYLEHHGAKLVKRFDANSYIVIGEAMNSHDVGRGRGGIENALSQITAKTVIAGVDSDRLYPLHQQEFMARAIPNSGELQIVNSLYGHDAFLIETEQVAKIVSSVLDTL